MKWLIFQLVRLGIRYAAFRWILRIALSGWTAPNTAIASSVISASAHNTYIRDNFNYLHSGRPLAQVHYVGAANVNNGTTTWADIDSTNLSITVTTTSSRVLVLLSLRLGADNTGSSQAQCDVIVDGTTRAGSTNGLIQVPQNRDFWVMIPAFFSGLSNGSHTFRPQIRNATGGAIATAYNNGIAINMVVIEV